MMAKYKVQVWGEFGTYPYQHEFKLVYQGNSLWAAVKAYWRNRKVGTLIDFQYRAQVKA